MSEFQIVERPAAKRGARGRWAALVAAVVETLETGKAVEVPAPDLPSKMKVTNAIRWHFNNNHRDLAIKQRANGESVYFWAVKR